MSDEADRLREQRPEDDLGAFIDRLLCADTCGFCGAAIVFDQKLNVRIVELGDRHFRGVAQGLTGDPGIAGSRQRQDESGFDLAGADRRGQRGLRGLRGRGGQILRGLRAAGQKRACGAKEAGDRAAARWPTRRALNLQLRGHGSSPHGGPNRRR